jgi:mRNA-degrading endonuclease RelE of RelBE toxin-antitoxin system
MPSGGAPKRCFSCHRLGALPARTVSGTNRGLIPSPSKAMIVRLTMYQIVFNEISAAEMARIPKDLQLELLTEFQFLPDDLDHLDSKAFGIIEREGKRLYRYRTNDYRIYFERSVEGILVHRVLHKNTIRDFLFRSKLPMGEDEQLEQNASFWKLIDEGKKTRK